MRAMRWWSGCGIVVLSTVLGCGGSSDSKDPTLVDVWFVQKIKVGGAELAGVDGFFQVRQNRSVRGFLAYETTVGTATVARSADFTGSLKASDGNLELNLKADRTQDEVVLSDLQLTTEGATRTYQVSEVGKTLSFKIVAGSVSVELEFLGLLGTWTLSALVEDGATVPTASGSLELADSGTYSMIRTKPTTAGTNTVQASGSYEVQRSAQGEIGLELKQRQPAVISIPCTFALALHSLDLTCTTTLGAVSVVTEERYSRP